MLATIQKRILATMQQIGKKHTKDLTIDNTLVNIQLTLLKIM